MKKWFCFISLVLLIGFIRCGGDKTTGPEAGSVDTLMFEGFEGTLNDWYDLYHDDPLPIYYGEYDSVYHEYLIPPVYLWKDTFAIDKSDDYALSGSYSLFIYSDAYLKTPRHWYEEHPKEFSISWKRHFNLSSYSAEDSAKFIFSFLPLELDPNAHGYAHTITLVLENMENKIESFMIDSTFFSSSPNWITREINISAYCGWAEDISINLSVDAPILDTYSGGLKNIVDNARVKCYLDEMKLLVFKGR